MNEEQAKKETEDYLKQVNKDIELLKQNLSDGEASDEDVKDFIEQARKNFPSQHNAFKFSVDANLKLHRLLDSIDNQDSSEEE